MQKFKESLKEVIRAHKKLISRQSLTSGTAAYTPASVNCLILMMEALLSKYEQLEKTKDAAASDEPVIDNGLAVERLTIGSLVREELDLTDRFAIAAMAAYEYSDAEHSLGYEGVAKSSYALARAMVFERQAILCEIATHTHLVSRANENQD